MALLKSLLIIFLLYFLLLFGTAIEIQKMRFKKYFPS
jgi:hypothetical protein